MPYKNSKHQRQQCQQSSNGGSNNNEEDRKMRKLFVDKLSSHITEDDIYDVFKKHGEIEEVAKYQDRRAPKRYFAFVVYKNAKDCYKATKEPNPMIKGKRCACMLAAIGKQFSGYKFFVNKGLLTDEQQQQLQQQQQPSTPILSKSNNNNKRKKNKRKSNQMKRNNNGKRYNKNGFANNYIQSQNEISSFLAMDDNNSNSYSYSSSKYRSYGSNQTESSPSLNYSSHSTISISSNSYNHNIRNRWNNNAFHSKSNVITRQNIHPLYENKQCQPSSHSHSNPPHRQQYSNNSPYSPYSPYTPPNHYHQQQQHKQSLHPSQSPYDYLQSNTNRNRIGHIQPDIKYNINQKRSNSNNFYTSPHSSEPSSPINNSLYGYSSPDLFKQKKKRFANINNSSYNDVLTMKNANSIPAIGPASKHANFNRSQSFTYNNEVQFKPQPQPQRPENIITKLENLRLVTPKLSTSASDQHLLLNNRANRTQNNNNVYTADSMNNIFDIKPPSTPPLLDSNFASLDLSPTPPPPMVLKDNEAIEHPILTARISIDIAKNMADEELNAGFTFTNYDDDDDDDDTDSVQTDDDFNDQQQ